MHGKVVFFYWSYRSLKWFYTRILRSKFWTVTGQKAWLQLGFNFCFAHVSNWTVERERSSVHKNSAKDIAMHRFRDKTEHETEWNVERAYSACAPENLRFSRMKCQNIFSEMDSGGWGKFSEGFQIFDQLVQNKDDFTSGSHSNPSFNVCCLNPSSKYWTFLWNSRT